MAETSTVARAGFVDGSIPRPVRHVQAGRKFEDAISKQEADTVNARPQETHSGGQAIYRCTI
jgi:hypothetical protein